MGDLQWNLLNTNAPAQTSAAFNPLGAYQQGAESAQKYRANELAMDKTRQDMEYAPMKIYAGMMGKEAAANKATAGANKMGIEAQIKAHELRRVSADTIANTPDEMIGQAAMELAVKNAEILGASSEQVSQAHAHIQQVLATKGPAGLREEALLQSQDAKLRLAESLGQGKLEQGGQRLAMQQQQGDTRNQIAATNAQTGQGNLAVNQQRLNQPNVQFINTGEAYVPVDKKQPLAAQPELPIANQTTAMITEEAKEAAAHRYLLDGTLPPLGIGKQGAILKTEILNKASQLAESKGIKPEDQRPGQIGVAATKSALTQVSKQEGMVGAFERNFVKNVELAEKASQEVDRTGVPIVNKWINAGKRAITGDVALSKFDIAVKAAVNEYTKIISGSMGNTVMAQSEIEKVNSLLNAAQTQEQVQGVLDFMKLETKNRMAGFADEKQRMKGELQLPGVNNSLKTIASDNDYNALPSGTEFIAPDGSKRRKP